LSGGKKDDSSTPSKKGRGVNIKTEKSDETLTGMVSYNGAMLDIESLLERLSKGEQSMLDYETKISALEEERGGWWRGCV